MDAEHLMWKHLLSFYYYNWTVEIPGNFLSMKQNIHPPWAHKPMLNAENP